MDLTALIRRPEYSSGRRLMSDSMAIGFAVAAMIGLGGLLLPVPETLDVQGTVATGLASLTLAGVVVWLRERMPYWGYQLAVLAATALITASIHFNGDPANANAMLYLVAGMYAFYFFRLSEAVGQTLLMGVAYGLVSASINPDPIEANMLVLFAGVILLTGMLVRLLGLRASQLVHELSGLVTRDQLTGLLNRRGFQDRIDLELERAGRSGRAFSLVVADLDGFKGVNDRLGHMGGDMALERVGSILNRVRRKVDSVARLGGEEFAIVLPDTDANRAYVVAERVRVQIEEGFAKRPVKLTISIGIATYPEHGASVEELLHAADHGLYAAKALGRNRCVIYSAEADKVLEESEAFAEGEPFGES